MVPVAMASHHAGPPDETGMGAGDVTNEPNHADDDNGLACPDGCVESAVGDPLNGGGQLVLDADISTGAYPYFVDVNSVLRNTIADAPGYEHQDRIYPGTSFMAAWWGWWADKGQGGILRDDQANPAGSIPGVADGNADGTINDGHDDHESNEDTRYTGPWDELVWRGTNPWATQHGHESKDDVMYAFIHPGTHDTGPATDPFSNVVGSEADDPKAPDYTMDDRTAQGEQSPGPVPHNNQGYGWVNNIGWYGNQYDQSFFITTKVTTSVNPDPTTGGLYLPQTGDGVDVDVYESVHPQAEQAYRTTVWDPAHVDEEDSDENPNILHENGTKEWVKERWNDEGDQAFTLVNDVIDELTKPASPTLGAVDDNSGAKPRPHEPDVAGQNYGGNAQYDDDTYGDFGEEYYQPGDDRHYDGFQSDYKPFMDLRSWMAGAQYNVQIRGWDSYNVYAANTDNAERTQNPGLFWMSTNLGAWYDSTEDNWVGNLDEEGRSTSSDNPYADGQVDDPHDYEDTPAAHRNSEDVEDWTPEWKPAGTSSTVTATLSPVCDPAETNDQGECPWGSTSPPAGVYVVEDHDTHVYNPYDDMAEDVVGEPICSVPDVSDVNCDEDRERLSQHVQYGEIEVTFVPNQQADPGTFFMAENILFPTGTANYEVQIEGQGTINEDIQDNTGTSLADETVTDTDYLKPSDLMD